jgi:hypothetical protein
MDPQALLPIAARLVVHLARLAWWPVAKLIGAAIILLRPFYVVITFALLPFIHLAHALVRVLSLPFSVKWLEQIEVNSESCLLYPNFKLNRCRHCTSFWE